MKHYLSILLICIPILGYSQQNISGVVNEYYSVSTIVNGSNSITCAGESLVNLSPGDKVLLIQMKGADIDRSDANWYNTGALKRPQLKDTSAVGRFEFLAIQSVNDVTKQVTFTANLKRIYYPDEKLQLVKIYEAEEINVSGTVTSLPWDGKKGGVVALVALKKLTLNANIDVSAQGYRGASPISYTVGCRPYYAADTIYFDSTEVNKAGKKGEGVISDTFRYTIGAGYALNGGGGAAGQFGGGGGGGNFGKGGDGGSQNESCGISHRAYGGINLGKKFYLRVNEAISKPNELRAIAMGGGGGASNTNGANMATNGGNGGGIVILLADTLAGNTNSILADGQSVTSNATSGAGGGGGGGTVVIDASEITSSLNISVKGGSGGNTITNCNGAGGGGGGGVYWHNNASIHAQVSVDTSFGSQGITLQGGCDFLLRGEDGVEGATLNNYEPLLNGFSFNAIAGNDTVCIGDAPRELYGSTPRGVAPFTIKWLSSLDGSVWNDIGVSTKNYQPPALGQTIYYTRVVTNNDGKSDTAIAVKIWVWDNINNNDLTLTDTLCYGGSPGSLSAGALAGGNGNYSYTWETKTDLQPWTQNTAWENIPNPIEGNLSETKYYRRIVRSARVCIDTSNIDTLTVHPLISNNLFNVPDTTICEGSNAGTLRASQPTGGLEGSYTYTWLVSADNIIYQPAGATAAEYSPGTLSATRYYKRIVKSGNDSACMDTTTVPRTINVLNKIVGNTISITENKYCSGDIPQQLIGGELSGAQPGDYRISWWVNNGAGWNEIPGENSKNYQTGVLIDSIQIYRKVISGAFDACVENSNIESLDVIPPIQNAIGSPDETICEGETPKALIESPAGGGAGVGTYSYLWIQSNAINGPWSTASIDEGPNNTNSYSPAQLATTTFYKRKTSSDICVDTSNSIKISVYPKITNNAILGAPEQYTCYKSRKQLNGKEPLGGKPSSEFDYKWQYSLEGTNWTDALGDLDLRDYNSEELVVDAFFRRIVNSGENAECRDTSTMVKVIINQLPTGSISSKIDTLCAGDELEIAYSLAGNGPWTIEFGDKDLVHKEKNITEATGTIKFPVNVTADVKVWAIIDDSTCYADTSLVPGVVNTTVYEVPVSDAGLDIEVCGLTAKLAAIPSVGNGSWSGSGVTFENNTLSNSSVQSLGYGSIKLKWKETNWRECVDEDEVDVMFYEQPVLIDAGEDLNLKYEFSAGLNALEPEIGYGKWRSLSEEVELVDSTLSNTIANFNKTGEHILVWMVENGVCQVISDSIVVVIDDIVLYGGFSPNNDNQNDTYNIDLQEGKKGNLTVLDINGNIVAQIEDVGAIKWDGANQAGQQVPEGTYFYILVEEGGTQRKGYIELRR